MIKIIDFKKYDQLLPSPSKGTAESAGIDLYVRSTTVVDPNTPTLVPLNVAVQIPKGYFGMLVARSSLAKRFGVMLTNGVGIIDSDYCGNDDEIMASLISLTDLPVTIERGERIAQLIIIPFEKVQLNEVEVLTDANRGGFGSTN